MPNGDYNAMQLHKGCTMSHTATSADRLDELPLPAADPPLLAQVLAELVAVLPEPARTVLARRGRSGPASTEDRARLASPLAGQSPEKP